jgi:hypothetical protein
VVLGRERKEEKKVKDVLMPVTVKQGVVIRVLKNVHDKQEEDDKRFKNTISTNISTRHYGWSW